MPKGESADWASQYSEEEILHSLQYLVDEGFIVFEETDGEWFVKIAESV